MGCVARRASCKCTFQRVVTPAVMQGREGHAAVEAGAKLHADSGAGDAGDPARRKVADAGLPCSAALVTCCPSQSQVKVAPPSVHLRPQGPIQSRIRSAQMTDDVRLCQVCSHGEDRVGFWVTSSTVHVSGSPTWKRVSKFAISWASSDDSTAISSPRSQADTETHRWSGKTSCTNLQHVHT
jgi:hypothetical protein